MGYQRSARHLELGIEFRPGCRNPGLGEPHQAETKYQGTRSKAPKVILADQNQRVYRETGKCDTLERIVNFETIIGRIGIVDSGS